MPPARLQTFIYSSSIYLSVYQKHWDQFKWTDLFHLYTRFIFFTVVGSGNIIKTKNNLTPYYTIVRFLCTERGSKLSVEDHLSLLFFNFLKMWMTTCDSRLQLCVRLTQKQGPHSHILSSALLNRITSAIQLNYCITRRDGKMDSGPVKFCSQLSYTCF